MLLLCKFYGDSLSKNLHFVIFTLKAIDQKCLIQLLEVHFYAKFSFNPIQTHLNKLITAIWIT